MPHREAGHSRNAPAGAELSVQALRAACERRLEQLSAVARLTRLALTADVNTLVDDAVDELCRGLSADAGRILALVDDEEQLWLRAAWGAQYRPDKQPPDQSQLNRRALVHADRRTAAGRALHQQEAVRVDNFEEDRDLQRLPLFDATDFSSAIEVQIPGPSGPYGVLGAHSRGAYAFGAGDAEFISTIANVIGESLQRQHAEAHQRRALEELDRTLAAREEVLSVISHDLRSPASAMKLSLEVVRRAVTGQGQSIAPEQVERAIAKANSNLDRMLTMTDKMLEVNERETDLFELEWEEVDLREVVDDVVDSLSEPLEMSESSVAVSGDDEVIGCWDWMRLEQVTSNLLSNAIKYGEGSPIEIEVLGRGDEAILRVSDRGRGIPRDQQRRIFERFARFDARDSEPMPQSYGLGLWIVRRIVDAFDGSIEVESATDQGTTFTVVLPRKPRRTYDGSVN